MALYLFLFLLQLISGLVIHAVSLRANAFHAMAYLLRALLRTIKRRLLLSQRAFRILSFVAAFVVFEAGFSFFSRAFLRVLRPDDLQPSFVVMVLLVGAILLRRYIASFDTWIGQKAGVPELLAEAKKVRKENILTGICILMLLAARLLGVNADYMICLVITISVMKEGIMIAIEAARPMIEERVDEDLLRTVKEKVASCSGIIGCGNVEARFFGPGRRMISMYVAMPAEGDIAQQMESLRVIEKMIGEECGVSLTLHPRLIETADPEAMLAFERLGRVVDKLDGHLSFDHFHMVRGRSFDNLIFDLYLPDGYTDLERESMVASITEQMKAIDPRYSCICTWRR